MFQERKFAQKHRNITSPGPQNNNINVDASSVQFMNHEHSYLEMSRVASYQLCQDGAVHGWKFMRGKLLPYGTLWCGSASWECITFETYSKTLVDAIYSHRIAV
ncbi:hypothetical protein L195_g044922 [Trifolium pratense]|uniref:Uncharacterized protein n=1 Tax=Trifolium pratense TaxID=57577 RepID=A0A2K3MDF2_TRIPR|nr:hypothetical protein L195_g044922 [Trifolium pratense]